MPEPNAQLQAVHLQVGYGGAYPAAQQAPYGSVQAASGAEQHGYGAATAQQGYGQPSPAAPLASDQQSKLAQIIAQVNTAEFVVHSPASLTTFQTFIRFPRIQAGQLCPLVVVRDVAVLGPANAPQGCLR